MEQNKLRDQVVVVTGASSGIGRAVALEAASQGARLFLLARHQDALLDVKANCERLSQAEATAISVDIGEVSEIEAAVEKIKTRTDRVDVLFNSAGFGDFKVFAQVPVARIQQMFAVNVLGLMVLTRELAPLLFDCRGHIINMGSMAGKIPTPKSAIYSATKAAVIAFSDALRLELRPLHVQVTTVNPGPVKTNFFKTADKGGQYVKKIAWLSLDAERLARRIVAAFHNSVREINAPWPMAVAARLYPLMPKVGDFFAATIGNQK